MRAGLTYLKLFLCFAALAAFPAAAKEGIHAIVHTSIQTDATEGSQLEIRWTLADEESGEPFNACNVFVRLIGPSGESTEGFARCGANPDGNYSAIVEVPKGGVSDVEIGVAGRGTNREGHSQRSDWLMPLANTPIEE